MLINQTLSLKIEKKADNVCTDSYKQKLSIVKARSVASYLNRLGVYEDRFIPEGYGESQPVATNETDEGP